MLINDECLDSWLDKISIFFFFLMKTLLDPMGDRSKGVKQETMLLNMVIMQDVFTFMKSHLSRYI